MSNKESQSFLVTINVLEGRNYSILTMDSVVHVGVGKQKKVTAMISNSNQPFYNEVVF